MDPTLAVALLQLHPCATEAQALEQGELYCRRAHQLGAEIVLFPELWNTGYEFPESDEEVPRWTARAVAPDGPFVAHFRRLARELGLFVGLTFLEAFSPRPRNAFLLLDPQGRDALAYAKVHTCDFGDERHCTPGTEFRVATIQTSLGPVSVGAMICFDREFPESARVLMLKGAELVLVPNACDIETHRRNQLATRAFENMMGIALANYASGVGNGHSLAFDGMAFVYDQAADRALSRDQLLVEAGSEEGVVVARFNLAAMRAYRQREVWGNAYRRVMAYGPLLDAKP